MGCEGSIAATSEPTSRISPRVHEAVLLRRVAAALLAARSPAASPAASPLRKIAPRWRSTTPT